MQDQRHWVDPKPWEKRRADKQAQLDDQVDSDAQSQERDAGGSGQKRYQDKLKRD